jgi:hypothetical protein
MSQVLALDLPRTLAGNLAPIGCEYQGLGQHVLPNRLSLRSLRTSL